MIQKIMSPPHVLRARAEIRRWIALQDKEWGDTLAVHRNIREAERLEEQARATEGG
jgi:hypothetical protein